MTTELVPVATNQAVLMQFAPRVMEYALASRSENTLRGYRSDWRDFEGWCARHGFASLPAHPDTVAAYLSAMADSGLKSGSIQRRVSSISANHVSCGYDSPTVKASVKLTLAGIRRKLGVRQEGKSPVLTSDVAAMLSRVPNTLLGTRDRALILIGYAGAFRRSELVGLDVKDIEFTPDGAKIRIRKSKTDQEGAGQTVAIANGGALCPVKALRGWLDTSGITNGPVFRSVRRYGQLQAERLTDQTVADVVKRYAAAVGLDARKFAGHSLRAGLVTQAAMNGVQELSIMKQTRHKSSDMLRKYIREANMFRDNASASVGL